MRALAASRSKASGLTGHANSIVLFTYSSEARKKRWAVLSAGVLLDEDKKSFRAQRSTLVSMTHFEVFSAAWLFVNRSVFVEKNNDSAEILLRPPREEDRKSYLERSCCVEVSRSLPSFRFLFVQGVAEEKGGQRDPDRQTDPYGESSFFFADGHGKDSLPSLGQGCNVSACFLQASRFESGTQRPTRWVLSTMPIT